MKNQNQITHIIAKEIYQQLLQNLQQTGLTYTENQHTITYKDTNQQNAQITLNYLNTTHSHIQLQKHPAHWERPIITTDIIIDEQKIYIRTYRSTKLGALSYELTDPNSIQNAIQTILQIL